MTLAGTHTRTNTLARRMVTAVRTPIIVETVVTGIVVTTVPSTLIF